MYVWVHMSLCVCVFVCVCAGLSTGLNKALARIISNCEFKLLASQQCTELRVATFHFEACIMSHQSLKNKALAVIMPSCSSPSVNHGSCENAYLLPKQSYL